MIPKMGGLRRSTSLLFSASDLQDDEEERTGIFGISIFPSAANMEEDGTRLERSGSVINPLGSPMTTEPMQVVLPQALPTRSSTEADEDGLVFKEAPNKKRVVVAGKLDKMIIFLADSKFQDTEFIKTFLQTHRYFIDSGVLLLKLIQR
jgi:hypothetical protein